jgi:hypothetical protein
LQLSSGRKKKQKIEAHAGGLGQKSYDNRADMDRPQPFSDDLLAFDAVFFSGANVKGQHFVIATQRKQNQKINGLFYIQVMKQ